MNSQTVQPCSPADLWHDRLNQSAHRAACLGWLMLPLLAFPARFTLPTVAAIVMCTAIVATACSFCSSLLVRPDNGDLREAAGVFVFSLLLLIASWVVAVVKLHLELKPILVTWLRLDFEPQWLRWSLRAAAALLVGWIAVATALSRRGEE
ncbi:MAG: hypothetical protein ACHRHE_16915 [Tepidisphaerales bacterium]